VSIDQHALRDSARRLLASVVAAPPLAAWQAIVEAGWPALTTPAALGGLDQPLAAACWIYGELGRALSPLPLLPSLLAVATLRACPASAARDAWIERIAAGFPIAMPLRDPRAIAAPTDIVPAVAGAAHAEHVLILTEDAVAIVNLRQPGARLNARTTWDTTRGLSDLHLEHGLPPSTEILASGEAAAIADSEYAEHVHFAIAADCVGAAAAALEATTTHLKTRQQFGRPLALFQALKHRCAGLMTELQAADALLADYSQAHESATPPASLALARGAKALASTVFRQIAEESIQLHGGMGMTDEHRCHRFLKRALLNEQLASTNDACAIAVGAASCG